MNTLSRNPELWLYVLHAGFWISFGITRLVVRARGSAPSSAPVAPTAPATVAGKYSRLVIIPHIIAFGIMYYGIDDAVFHNRIPEWLPGQRILGAVIISSGAALSMWALLYFRSWRFRAKLDAGHELATGGPFHYSRHPIYLSLALLAIGTAVWTPTPALLIAAALMVLGSDIRARAEESVLLSVFGDAYRAYMAHTRRFIPGVY
jgi:protein-S-isoprenylcysteine O-methyltransferase Ste14